MITVSGEARVVGVKSTDELDPIFMTKKDFARYISRSPSTVNRLIRQGVILALHDGRTVTIPVKANATRYLSYLKAREKQHRSLNQQPTEQRQTKEVSSELANRVLAMGDFIVDRQEPRTSTTNQVGDTL